MRYGDAQNVQDCLDSDEEEMKRYIFVVIKNEKKIMGYI